MGFYVFVGLILAYFGICIYGICAGHKPYNERKQMAEFRHHMKKMRERGL